MFFLNRRSDGDTKAAESTKRKLSADLAVNKSHLDIKKRDGKSYLSFNFFLFECWNAVITKNQKQVLVNV